MRSTDPRYEVRHGKMSNTFKKGRKAKGNKELWSRRHRKSTIAGAWGRSMKRQTHRYERRKAKGSIDGETRAGRVV